MSQFGHLKWLKRLANILLSKLNNKTSCIVCKLELKLLIVQTLPLLLVLCSLCHIILTTILLVVQI
jgi:uncharacterized protein (DUF983 family)